MQDLPEHHVDTISPAPWRALAAADAAADARRSVRTAERAVTPSGRPGPTAAAPALAAPLDAELAGVPDADALRQLARRA